MLNLNQIESFYPENLRIYKRNLLREYLQYVILDIIYSSEYGNRLVFMGGTAIHFSKTNPNFNFLKEKMKLKENINTKEIKEKLLLKCEKINFKELAEDLKPFLFYPSDAEKILLFTELIQTKM
jgi:hypothetical protein